MAALATPPPVAPAPSSTPAPSAAPAAAPASIPSTMGDALTALFAADAAAAPTPSETTPPADTPAPQASPTEPPAAEPSTATQAQPEAPIELPTADLDEVITAPDSTDAEGRRHFYSKTRSEKLLAGQALLNQMREVVPNLTMDSFKEMAGRASAASVMMGLFHKASDANAAPQDKIAAMNDIVDYFGTENPVSAGVLAIRLNSELQRYNPQAAQAIDRMYTGRLVGNLRSGLGSMVDPAAKESRIALIQNLEQALFGQFTPREALLNGQAVSPQAPNLEVERLRQENERFRNQQREQTVTGLARQIDDAQQSAVWGSIDEAIAPIKGRFNDRTFNFLRSQLRQEVAQAEQAHPEWAEQHQALFARAQLTGAPQDINALANYRRQIAQRVIRLNGPKVISELTGVVVNQNRQQQQNAQRPPNEPSLNGVGTPAPQNGVDAMLKADNWESLLKAAGLQG